MERKVELSYLTSFRIDQPDKQKDCFVYYRFPTSSASPALHEKVRAVQ